jgi:hypothetical protein
MMPQPPTNDDVRSTLLDLADKVTGHAEQLVSICKTPLAELSRPVTIKARDGISHAAYVLGECAELLSEKLTPWLYKKKEQKEHGLRVLGQEAKRVVLFFIPTTL